MHQYILIEIGKKIRKVRQDKDMIIQDLADRAGVSKGLISRIENNRAIPSLPVLIDIIKALDVEVSDFFGDVDQSASGPILIKRANELEPQSRENAVGFTYFPLLERNMSDTVIQTTLLRLEPHSQREYVTTDGFEFKYVLDGAITYDFNGEEVTLNTGDSIFFDGRIPHVPMNRTDKPASMLVVYLFSTTKD